MKSISTQSPPQSPSQGQSQSQSQPQSQSDSQLVQEYDHLMVEEDLSRKLKLQSKLSQKDDEDDDDNNDPEEEDRVGVQIKRLVEKWEEEKDSTDDHHNYSLFEEKIILFAKEGLISNVVDFLQDNVTSMCTSIKNVSTDKNPNSMISSSERLSSKDLFSLTLINKLCRRTVISKIKTITISPYMYKKMKERFHSFNEFMYIKTRNSNFYTSFYKNYSQRIDIETYPPKHFFLLLNKLSSLEMLTIPQDVIYDMYQVKGIFPNDYLHWLKFMKNIVGLAISCDNTKLAYGFIADIMKDTGNTGLKHLAVHGLRKFSVNTDNDDIGSLSTNYSILRRLKSLDVSKNEKHIYPYLDFMNCLCASLPTIATTMEIASGSYDEVKNTVDLIDLNLSENNLGFHLNTFLTHVRHQNNILHPNLEVLNLSKNSLTASHLDRLCENLKYLKHLKYLNLSYNLLKKQGIESLCQSGNELQKLKDLNLSCVGMNDNGLMHLAQHGFKFLGNLENLDISNNMLTSSVLKLHSRFNTNFGELKNLRYLNLNNNLFDLKDLFNFFMSGLSKLKTLKVISINTIKREELEEKLNVELERSLVAVREQLIYHLKIKCCKEM